MSFSHGPLLWWAVIAAAVVVIGLIWWLSARVVRRDSGNGE